MNESKSIYTDKINRVTEYVYKHLHKSPSLEELAQIACLSSFHFHRIFRAITGETLNFHKNRLRLEKAAKLIKYSSQNITEVAFECGFSSSSTFARSFKNYFGISAKEYKKTGLIENSKICKELFPMDKYIVPMTKEELIEKFPVEIKEFPERRVAFIRVNNSYTEGKVTKAFKQMAEWAKAKNLYEAKTLFGMSIDDPMVTPAEKCRYEVCLTIPTSFDCNSEMSTMIMPKCKYAVTKVYGDLKTEATAINYLFSNWLINSSYEPEHQHVLEIFLNKNNIFDWDNLELELCLPIK
jgi:AraC family transcriptional regulator